MSFVNTSNGDEQNEHDNSPVCRVLRRYFAEQQRRMQEIENLRRDNLELQIPSAQIGGNDVVQEG